MAAEIPKVYAWCNSGCGTEFQFWVAMHEDGTLLGTHCSSSRGWGLRDIRPPFKAKGYERAFGPDPVEGIDYKVVEIPDGKGPPDDVIARNRAQGEAAKAAEGDAS